MEYHHMGDLISEARKSKNLTQKDLAEKLNLTDKAVSKWERGTSCPDIGIIPRLADLLEISSDELLRIQKTAGDKDGTRQKIGASRIPSIDLVLKAVGMAMGIAVLVLSLQGTNEIETMVPMLAVGVTCIGIVQLRQQETKAE